MIPSLNKQISLCHALLMSLFPTSPDRVYLQYYCQIQLSTLSLVRFFQETSDAFYFTRWKLSFFWYGRDMVVNPKLPAACVCMLHYQNSWVSSFISASSISRISIPGATKQQQPQSQESKFRMQSNSVNVVNKQWKPPPKKNIGGKVHIPWKMI